MTSSTLKSPDLSIFCAKYVMWRYVTSVTQIFIRISESIDVNDISILSNFQVNVIIFDKVMVSRRFSHFSHILAYFGTLMAVFPEKDRIDLKFAQDQEYSKVNIFWWFCENPPWWRHVRTPDVIWNDKKSVCNKCWRQQNWVKMAKMFFDFQNVYSHSF